MEKICFEYGAMSSKYKLYAENKLTAYSAMVVHFGSSAHLIALYEPADIVENDSWLNPFGKISNRLDEIFGGEGSFDNYLKTNIDQIREAYESMETIC